MVRSVTIPTKNESNPPFLGFRGIMSCRDSFDLGAISPEISVVYLGFVEAPEPGDAQKHSWILSSSFLWLGL